MIYSVCVSSAGCCGEEVTQKGRFRTLGKNIRLRRKILVGEVFIIAILINWCQEMTTPGLQETILSLAVL